MYSLTPKPDPGPAFLDAVATEPLLSEGLKPDRHASTMLFNTSPMPWEKESCTASGGP